MARFIGACLMFRAGSNRSARVTAHARTMALRGPHARARQHAHMALRSAAIRSRLTAHARLPEPSRCACWACAAAGCLGESAARSSRTSWRAISGGRATRCGGRCEVEELPERADLQPGGRPAELPRVPLGGRRRFGPRRRRRPARLGGSLRADAGAPVTTADILSQTNQNLLRGDGRPRHGGRLDRRVDQPATPSGSRRRPPRPPGWRRSPSAGSRPGRPSYRFGAAPEDQCDEAFRR